MKFVPWTVVPGTPQTCLTSLLQKSGKLKTWLFWNWLFCGTIFSTIRGRNGLHFSRFQNGWPDVPRNFKILPCDSFMIRAAAEQHWKLSWILVFQKISLTFFFFNLSAAFSVDFNCYEQLLERINSFVSYFYLRWRNFSIVIPRSNEKNGFFKLLSQMVVSLPDVTQSYFLILTLDGKEKRFSEKNIWTRRIVFFLNPGDFRN